MSVDFTDRSRPFGKLPIVALAFERQKKLLPKSLAYHDFGHVVDVFNEAIEFGTQDKLDQRSLELLAIAAVFHDMGFIEKATENELLGAKEAALAMQSAGSYTQEEIKLVERMILDTQFKFTSDGPCQVPTTELSKYLCDADVSNLGRTDFFIKAELVRTEVGAADKKEFLTGVSKFLKCHQWYTPAAKRVRQDQKNINLAELIKIIA